MDLGGLLVVEGVRPAFGSALMMAPWSNCGFSWFCAVMDCRLGCGLGGNDSKTNLCYENRLPELFLISVVITANLFSVLPFSPFFSSLPSMSVFIMKLMFRGDK